MSIISDTINGTNTKNLLIAEIDKQVQQSPVNFATNILKSSTDIKEAIVSVLSNTGIAGFKFHIQDSEQAKMQSDITDYYTDHNMVVQDHVARRPITITLRGLEGEYFYSVNPIEDTLAKVVPTLKLVEEFLPKISNRILKLKTLKHDYNVNWQAYAAVKQAQNKTINSSEKFGVAWDTLNGVDIFKIFQDLYKLKSAQTRAYLFLETMWKAGEPFTIETRWKRYNSMLIQELTPLGDKNADITDFTVTFKQIDVTQSVYEDLNNAAGRTRQQLMETVNKGIDKGKEVSTI